MTTDEQLLFDLADAVLDARPLDWAAASSRASDSSRALIAHFQAVAGISSFHLELSISAQTEQQRNSAASPSGPVERDDWDEPAAWPIRWGPLTIVGKIGCGRFGDVYRAVDPRLDRPVALKLLRHADGRDRAESAAIDEGRLMARVRHPNVVTVYGAERIDGRIGLWMELVDGRTLEEELRERGPLPWDEVARIGVDLCRALSAVHRAGLLHRDLKAQNVLREVEGRVVLADFGAGRILTSESDDASDLAGTPLYLAPEVFEGAPATKLSDLYSLGVLLFHLVTGAYPVRGRSLDDLREAHRQQRRSWLRDVRSDLPAAFVAAVDGALGIGPEQRHAHVEAFEGALARSTLSHADVGKATPETAARRPRRDRRSASLLAATVLAAVLAGATIAAVVPLWRSSPPAARTPTRAAETAAVPALRKMRLPSFDTGLPSLDGRFFPYFDDEGRLLIWEVATGRSRGLTDAPAATERGRSSLASPNGDRVVSTWSLGEGRFELRLINADGTWPRVLISRQTSYEPVPVDWSRDGRDILCWLRQKNGSADLVLVPADGGVPRVIHTFAATAPAGARLSPDGRFVVTSPASDDRLPRDALLILDTAGSEPRVLVDGAEANSAPAWMPDGQHVMFLRASSALQGSHDVWIAPVADGAMQGPPTLLTANIGIARVWLTDRGEMYRRVSSVSADAYTASIDLTGATPSGPPTRISQLEVGNHVAPMWSPDGQSMAYFTIREPTIPGAVPLRTLTIQDIRSGRARKLPLPFAFLSGYTPIWSPDGRAVVVSAKDEPSDARIGFYRVDLQSGEASALVVTGNADSPPFAAFSPDGQNFLYVDPTRGIVSRRLADGAEGIVVAKGDRSDIGRIAVAPDGHALAFIGGTEHQGRWSYALEVQEVTRPPRVIARAGPPMMLRLETWTPDSRDVMYSLGHTSNPYKLLRMSASGGEPVDLRFSMIPSPSPISLNPDGRRIAYVERVVEPELWISPLTVSR